MIDKYLPVGSVVLLKGGKKRVVIIGRDRRDEAGEKSWDYLACLYPEGFLGKEYAYLFDHEQIERIFFIGFQDGEELAFAQLLSEGSLSLPGGED